MTASVQPIYLLADSQLLFWQDGESRFLDSIRRPGPSPGPRAAYVGAANGDVPEFYRIFEAAMDLVGVRDRRMIRSIFPPEDETFLAAADIILLAGGDVEHGWKVLTDSGMRDLIAGRHDAGATLIGVSAGAMHLGLYGAIERGESTWELFDTFKFCPFVVASHDERRDWSGLVAIVRSLNGAAKGLAIPSGAGVVYRPDGSMEAVRYPAQELVQSNGDIERRVVPASGRSAHRTP